jgi:SAM-dependent methyltransferase
LISAAVIDAVKRRTPPALYPLARTVLHRFVVPLECWGVAVADRVLSRRYDGRVLPPAWLRYKVRGSASGHAFARIGRACANDIDAALRSCGHSVAQSRRILDFGCGCGGTMLWLNDLAPTASISGADIDASAIEWCRGNIPFAKFAINEALPPLAYPDASFDLVYAVSVFTHLDEDYQFLWLAELERIIVPGGVCVVTVVGPGSWNEMPVSDQQTLADRGFVYIRTEATNGLFPDWYQSAFHLRSYVEANFSRYFDIIGFVARGLAEHQDVIVLQRRRERW